MRVSEIQQARAHPMGSLARVPCLRREQANAPQFELVAPVMMAEDPGRDLRACRGVDHLVAIAVGGGREWRDAKSRVTRRRMGHMVCDNKCWPRMWLGQALGEPGARQAVLLERVLRQERGAASANQAMIGARSYAVA